ncbi:hypothetical protein AUC68_03335 [Methyloceanibacter methanicus]|uniref:CBS domain-containing protein n=1 Tax=Methyloceanibacter methanicus TaxID=1774968 RepID=A0A1E3W4U6_9HYPH|nr:CBS domain-containing protein [Methyloceanibacter methanicus]ODS00157.1 hypothetical protein AUC68_03335 [Methyloceanibacter methanicus]
MTNRKLADILGNQRLLALREYAPVREACGRMWDDHKGSVLVVDQDGKLVGIFTGRDAVRTLAEGKSAEVTPLGEAMTRNPVTVPPTASAVDALREMSDRGIRHLPVVENERIIGVVSRGDFKGMEIDRLDEDDRLAECLR